MLVSRVEQQAKNSGYSVVNLDVRETQVAAIKLYESMEFERYATHPAYAYVDGHYVAGHYYMKILDAV
jgi:ribosomal protein S18 acetylase RimI-like enzyme